MAPLINVINCWSFNVHIKYSSTGCEISTCWFHIGIVVLFGKYSLSYLLWVLLLIVGFSKRTFC